MALINCPECGKEVSEKAGSCPTCGHPLAESEPINTLPPNTNATQQPIIQKQKKKGSCLKTLLIVVGAVVVIAVIASLGGGNDKKPKKVDSPNKASSDETSAANSEAQTESKDIFTVGEVAEYNDVQVSVLGFEESDAGEYIKPDDGKQFVFVNIEIANNSKSDLNISSMLSFETYCDDYKMDYSGNALMALNGRNQLDGSIASGKKLNGFLSLEVPTDWKVLEVHFTDNVWSSSKIKFEVTK